MIEYIAVGLVTLGVLLVYPRRRLPRREPQQFDDDLKVSTPTDAHDRKEQTGKRTAEQTGNWKQSYQLPNDPVLVRLLGSYHHRNRTSQPIIHDARGFRKNYPEFLGDVLQTVHLIKTAPSLLDDRGLIDESSPYIGVIVRSGYEFIVAFFAIRFLGGACMPIGKSHLQPSRNGFEESHKCVETNRDG